MDDLQRDLAAMKAQLQQLQDKMKQQEVLIEKLSAQPAATPTPVVE
ncbi:MAG: hypothetical protein HY270_08440, partial [Deltaproteobacteria bacterium]|nr:hypothetical protein [Deltaproteobacteria bacterium]